MRRLMIDVVWTLRACTTERRIPIRVVAWRFAPHNHADQTDIGRQNPRLFRPRGLSAAPLAKENMQHSREIDGFEDMNPPIT